MAARALANAAACFAAVAAGCGSAETRAPGPDVLAPVRTALEGLPKADPGAATRLAGALRALAGTPDLARAFALVESSPTLLALAAGGEKRGGETILRQDMLLGYGTHWIRIVTDPLFTGVEDVRVEAPDVLPALRRLGDEDWRVAARADEVLPGPPRLANYPKAWEFVRRRLEESLGTPVLAKAAAARARAGLALLPRVPPVADAPPRFLPDQIRSRRDWHAKWWDVRPGLADPEMEVRVQAALAWEAATGRPLLGWDPRASELERAEALARIEAAGERPADAAADAAREELRGAVEALGILLGLHERQKGGLPNDLRELREAYPRHTLPGVRSEADGSLLHGASGYRLRLVRPPSGEGKVVRADPPPAAPAGSPAYWYDPSVPAVKVEGR
ncbi:MAG: hypothetical protein L0216_21680 [Planctomycetales bacterium]|nr:hypothetical protein [Planctomycetales bacterium]